MPTARVTVFGGCNLRGPIGRAVWPTHRDPESNWDEVPAGLSLSGVPFLTFTLGEMLQTIQCYLGHRRIPSDFYPLLNIRPHLAPTPTNNPLERTDVVLVEPNTSSEIEFDGYCLNRAAIFRILNPIQKTNRAAWKLCKRWYNKGIVAMDAEARREVAEQLVPLLPPDAPDRELSASILRNANGRKCNVREALGNLVDAVDLPVGVVLYVWAYMPDGRSVSWPAELTREVIGAAADLNLPVFDPRPLVERAGTAVALKPNLRQYADSFMSVVAKPLVEFALSTADAGRPCAAGAATGSFKGAASSVAA